MRDAGEAFAHYTIEALLGRGGMGEVYRAFDTRLHRRVALKLLLLPDAPSAAEKSDAVARIIREARAAAALEHPNKVSVFELGEVDGTPYITMEYIAGSTLRAFVGDDGVDWKTKLGWLVDVARALDAAHAAGLVHRDIKPENVMVREDGIVKVLDFGIARRADTAADPSAATVAPAIEQLTGKGVIVGTAAYMPPEQMQGRELDGRADQFSWGVMAYEVLSGKHPWPLTGDLLALVGTMLTEPAAPLTGVPDVVAATVARTLRPRRDDRYPTMTDVVAVLAPAAGQTGPAARVRSDRIVVGAATTDEAMARTEASEHPPALGRKRGTRLQMALGALSVAAIVGGALGLARWRAARTTVEYCVDLVSTSRGPACRVSTDAASIPSRNNTFRLTSGPHGVTLVEKLNSAGLALNPLGNEENVRSDVRRAPDGSVLEVIDLASSGEELSRDVWSDGGTRVASVEPDGVRPRHATERVTQVRREFDARGFVRRETYLGVTGKPRSIGGGVFGRELEHGPDGLMLRETYLDADGKPMASQTGTATQVRQENARGLVSETRYLGLDGLPTTEAGAAIVRTDWAAISDVSEAYFDATGKPVASLERGTHGTRSVRDAVGRRLLETWVDEAGHAREKKGDAYATFETTYDDRGRLIRGRNLDAAGNLVIATDDGSAAYELTWDQADRVIEKTWLDVSLHPMAHHTSNAVRRYAYDSKGHRIEELSFDEDRMPLRLPDVGATLRRSYDEERGLLIEEATFDEREQRMPNQRGYAIARYRYDQLRNKIETAYLGTDGKPTLTNDGFASIRYRYDDDDNLVATSYLDAAGAATFFVGGYATKRAKYDDRGFVVEESYLDPNDNPVLVDGCAVVRYERDHSGDVTVEACLGKHGEPIGRPGGHATERNAYDIHRRRVLTSLLDASGAPVLGAEGWSIERLTYDERGLVVRSDHADTAGAPVITKAGCASIAQKYDARGNLVLETSLGTDGRPIVTSDGFATKRSTYNERDRLVAESLLGADGAPTVGKSGWSTKKLRYDDLGDVVEESFFDAENRPVVAKDPPYAAKRDKYDARRRLLETAYLDPSGAPARGPDGAALVRYKRDAYGRPVEVAYFDPAGGATTSADGKHLVRSIYDTAGRLTEELFFDAAESPHAAADGCAGHQTKYDDHGREVERTCTDPKGALAVGADGWAAKRSVHDARGNVVDEATYGADGALRADATGVGRRKKSYNERGLLQETTFFGADDRPTRDRRGAAAIRYRYDEAGKLLAETPVDDKGVPLKGVR